MSTTLGRQERNLQIPYGAKTCVDHCSRNFGCRMHDVTMLKANKLQNNEGEQVLLSKLRSMHCSTGFGEAYHERFGFQRRSRVTPSDQIETFCKLYIGCFYQSSKIAIDIAMNVDGMIHRFLSPDSATHHITLPVNLVDDLAVPDNKHPARHNLYVTHLQKQTPVILYLKHFGFCITPASLLEIASSVVISASITNGTSCT
ncbi:hypothetical protein BKA93DRAFT_131237 [Sparassis latifolia]